MGYVANIQKETLENNLFRKVLYTARHTQLVVMSIPVGGEIGMETHEDTDQFIRIERGEGKAILNAKEYALADDSVIIIPAGTEHNIVNTGTSDLKLYTLYSPPHHRDQVWHATRAEAESDDEHFDGVTTDVTERTR